MFILRKRHIGEIQVGIWDADKREKLEKCGVRLL